MNFTTEQKFNVLCQITRASHFEWRQAIMDMFPDENIMELVLKYWEIVGHDTAKAYLKKIDKDQPIAPQIAKMIVNSSLAMGESAEMSEEYNGNIQLIHSACPWYDWHQKHNALNEDQPGCDRWFQTIVNDINHELGSQVEVKTTSSLPAGDRNCLRIFSEKQS